MPRLVATTGGNKGNEYQIDKQLTVLGRHEESDLVVLDRRASRRHAQIELVERS